MQPLIRAARKRSLDFGLCYHRFEEIPFGDPKPGMAITPERFEGHLKALGEVGRFISLDEARVPSREEGIRFFLTFDDGYRDNATVLLPILERQEIPASLFVATGWLNGRMDALDHDFEAGFCPPGLTAEDLKRLGGHPLITIGAHTVTHRNLGRLTGEELRREIFDSRDWLREVVGQPIEHFAYPFGLPADMNWAEGMALLNEAGMKTVSSNYGGANRSPRETGVVTTGSRY
ncbi:MAG: polysaccharide deacetylase family protein, partial [Verrucomicrobiota bacterium]